ncbi:MAG TPA: phosphohydrolase [Nitrospiraceae bacterium]|nr:phosphohydrolase [Nitrospiraceae bacterium]
MNRSHQQKGPAYLPDVVLYHAECSDGFGAAWALWKKFPSARFIPVKHGISPPASLTGRRVVIVDFSYPRETLKAMAKETTSLQVLDHHITAEKALAGLPFAYFDQKKSGAVLAWEWAHPEPVPWLLQYIQDKDLWHWALPASREINAALASYPYDFRVWDELRQGTLEAEGRAILRYENELVGKIAEEAVLVSFHNETVPAVQSAVLTSQLGERLSAGYPFCVIWHDRDGRRYYSLRSRQDGTDVAAIAVSYGGGGHTHAAGFSVPLPTGHPSLTDLLVPIKQASRHRPSQAQPLTRKKRANRPPR